MMCPVIDNPTSCEIRSVICFLHSRNMSAVEVHLELCSVYDQNVVNEGTIRQCYRMFKDGQTNMHNEECSAWSAICSE
jgi:hypothetical protein